MKPLKLRIKGPAGAIETVVEQPARAAGAPAGGLALIAHPHPLKGGTLDNKVVWTLARAALEAGLTAARPNFRGVGASEGAFDHGIGETDDLHAVARALAAQFGPLPLTLLGFSFGAYAQQRLAGRLQAERLIMVAPAVSMYPFQPVALPSTIIHGDADEVVPYDAVRHYAQMHGIDLITLANAGHFFHGRLTELREHVRGLLTCDEAVSAT